MPMTYRFADYQRAAGAGQNTISLRRLYPEPERDAAGRIVRIRPIVPRLTAGEAVRLFQPYVATRFSEQFRAVVPLASYLVLFLFLILKLMLREKLQHCWNPACALLSPCPTTARTGA